jgi:hypothetical protein
VNLVLLFSGCSGVGSGGGRSRSPTNCGRLAKCKGLSLQCLLLNKLIRGGGDELRMLLANVLRLVLIKNTILELEITPLLLQVDNLDCSTKKNKRKEEFKIQKRQGIT